MPSSNSRLRFIEDAPPPEACSQTFSQGSLIHAAAIRPEANGVGLFPTLNGKSELQLRAEHIELIEQRGISGVLAEQLQNRKLVIGREGFKFQPPTAETGRIREVKRL